MARSEELADRISSALSAYSPVSWGACDTAGGPELPAPLGEFKRVLVVVIPFSGALSAENYTEPYFKGLQWETFGRMRRISATLKEFLNTEGVPWGALPSLESSDIDAFERDMTELFNAKEAARRAGLGWIGRSNLLVTERYGPRLSLYALLCDAPLGAGTPIAKSRCGDCVRCVENCAFHAIKGPCWTNGISRHVQVNLAACSRGRLTWQEKIGRKAVCGKCVAVCPWGSAWQS
jgi:epoxyqueuosine reductase QueG